MNNFAAFLRFPDASFRSVLGYKSNSSAHSCKKPTSVSDCYEMNPSLIFIGFAVLALSVPVDCSADTISDLHSPDVALRLASTVLPMRAAVVDKNPLDLDEPTGNIKVTFTDQHSEKWTKLGRAMLPRVSSTGLVGWATFKFRNYRGDPVDETVRICWPNGRHKDFAANGTYPFIEEWDFANHDTTIVIKSRGLHGSADYDEYDLASGKLIDYAHGLFGANLPVWAQPFSD